MGEVGELETVAPILILIATAQTDGRNCLLVAVKSLTFYELSDTLPRSTECAVRNDGQPARLEIACT
jgi:hypothetical protein